MPRILPFILVMLLSSSCIATNSKKNTLQTINQLELQEDIQRFYTRFTERIVESAINNSALMEEHKQDVIRQYLLYDSEALKIASAPFPVANLLDMLTFVKLNKLVVREYWVPKVYAKSGVPLFKAFVDSEKDLEQVSLKVLTQDQLTTLNRFVKEWRAENPNQIRVEKIRVADFSKFAKVEELKKSSFSLVDTATAAQSVDQMVLAANRALFLTQQLPFIIRLNTRIGTQEILSDTISSLQSAPKLVHEINDTKYLVNSVNQLVHEVDNLAKDVTPMLELLPKSFKGGINIHEGLSQLDSILERASALITQLQTRPPGKAQAALRDIREEMQGLIWYFVQTLVLAICFIMLFWWTGSYVRQRLMTLKGP